jgi:hypothetical protein
MDLQLLFKCSSLQPFAPPKIVPAVDCKSRELLETSSGLVWRPAAAEVRQTSKPFEIPARKIMRGRGAKTRMRGYRPDQRALFALPAVLTLSRDRRPPRFGRQRLAVTPASAS